MAFAEHEVLIPRDAMDVYTFLVDGMNLPKWRTGIRSISVWHPALAGPRARCTGRQCWAGPAGPYPPTSKYRGPARAPKSVTR